MNISKNGPLGEVFACLAASVHSQAGGQYPVQLHIHHLQPGGQRGGPPVRHHHVVGRQGYQETEPL